MVEWSNIADVVPQSRTVVCMSVCEGGREGQRDRERERESESEKRWEGAVPGFYKYKVLMQTRGRNVKELPQQGI